MNILFKSIVYDHQKVAKTQNHNSTSSDIEIPESLVPRDLLDLDNLKVYPNPSTGQMQIQFEGQKGMMNVSIYDSLGNNLYSQQIDETDGRCNRNLDVGHLPTGLYFLQVKMDNQSIVHRISIQ